MEEHMKSNRKKSLYISALISLALLSIAPISSANAKTYTNGLYRGARHFSYVETDFLWTVNNKNFITSSSATQWEEGFFTEAGGTTRTYTNGLEHIWNCRSKVVAGVWKLKYTKTFSDNVALRNNGNAVRV
jgi:hypothetical protein